MPPNVFLVFFFFQAEDGIRDYKVTGVQTCALPIWIRALGHGWRCESLTADQPGGFAEGSRRSPGGGGGDLRTAAKDVSCTPTGVPERGCRLVDSRLRLGLSGTPTGVQPAFRPVSRWSFSPSPHNDHRLLSGIPPG